MKTIRSSGLTTGTGIPATLNVDPDRTYVAGYSMGGYGTYRLGTLLSEHFAGAVSWAGVPTDSNRLENFHSLPLQIVHGTNDELVPVTGVIAQADRFRALGYEYRFHLHPGIDHFLLVWLDRWDSAVQWLGGRKRVENPPRVVFRLRPNSWTSATRSSADPAEILAHVAALGFDPDSSYWVRDVAVRDPDATSQVDVTSRAILDRDPQVTEYEGVGLGPPTPYLEEGVVRALGPVEATNDLDVVLTGIDAARMLLDRAGIDVSAEILVDVTTDGPSTLHLEGSFPGAPIVEDADTATPIPSSFSGGVLTFEVESSRRVRVLP